METTTHFSIYIINFSSYRTYEEWKLNKWEHGTPTLPRSYRTYEEWKLFSGSSIPLKKISSYRTYEEWKHFIPSSYRHTK